MAFYNAFDTQVPSVRTVARSLRPLLGFYNTHSRITDVFCQTRFLPAAQTASQSILHPGMCGY